jgi:hypothetical protein
MDLIRKCFAKETEPLPDTGRVKKVPYPESAYVDHKKHPLGRRKQRGRIELVPIKRSPPSPMYSPPPLSPERLILTPHCYGKRLDQHRFRCHLKSRYLCELCWETSVIFQCADCTVSLCRECYRTRVVNKLYVDKKN